MTKSLSKDYALLNIAKGIDLNSFIAVKNLLGTIAAGIYELEQNKIIELNKINAEGLAAMLSSDFSMTVKKELPSDLGYLKTLYNVIEKSEKKTTYDVIRMLCFDVKTLYSNQHVADIIGSLVSDNQLKENEKKGLLGKKKIVYEADLDSMKQSTASMLEALKNDTIDEHDTLLLYLLMKTDLLGDYYNSKEKAFIKEKLEQMKKTDNAIKDVLKIIDDILVILFALVAVFG